MRSVWEGFETAARAAEQGMPGLGIQAWSSDGRATERRCFVKVSDPGPDYMAAFAYGPTVVIALKQAMVNMQTRINTERLTSTQQRA